MSPRSQFSFFTLKPSPTVRTAQQGATHRPRSEPNTWHSSGSARVRGHARASIRGILVSIARDDPAATHSVAVATSREAEAEAGAVELG